MIERGKKYLRRSIDDLPRHQAPDIWEEIEKQLPANNEAGTENLERAISDLKEKQAPDVWTAVESELPIEKTPRRSTFKWAPWAAASIAVAFVAVLLLSKPASTDEITYSTEEVEFFNISEELASFHSPNDPVLDFIQKNCKQFVTKCQNPEFKGLFNTYLELNAAQVELEKQLEKTNNKEQLIKYLIRVEKNRTEIGKDMLKMLRFS